MSNAKRPNESKFDYDPFVSQPTSGDIVYKILGIEQDEIMARSPSIILSKNMRKDLDPNCELIEEEMDVITPAGELDNLKNLLQQEDLRDGDLPPKTIRRKMKKIKSSSKNLLSKKMNSLKTISSFGSELDNSSMHGSHSDISLYKPSTSLAEFGSTIIKKVKRSKQKYNRSSSDGVGMAALLVRSMMAAPTSSLDSIAENTSEPVHSSKRMSHMDATDSGSMLSLPTNKHHKHHVENKLNLCVGDSIIDLKASDSNLSSNASMSSPSISESSSEEEEDTRSEVADGGVVMIDADTISM